MSSTSLSTIADCGDEEIAEYASEVTAEYTAKVETTTNQLDKMHLDENFESDITTETETDNGTESESAESFVVLPTQEKDMKDFKDAFFDMTLQHEYLKLSIDKYRKLLQDFDFDSLKNKNNHIIQDEFYKLLEDQKEELLEIIYELNRDVQVPLKEVFLMQILNKRVIHLEPNNLRYHRDYLSHASNKIILNPKSLVRDYHNRISRGRRSRAKPITTINSFSKKYSAALSTQIDSIYGGTGGSAPSGNYNSNSWIDKLLSLFKYEKVQRFSS